MVKEELIVKATDMLIKGFNPITSPTPSQTPHS
jgi:hypothetical protein